MSYGVKYKQVDLIDNDFDKDKIYSVLLRDKVKLITIQRSKGYSTRESISIDKIAKIIKDNPTGQGNQCTPFILIRKK